jgi:hypothetical protein
VVKALSTAESPRPYKQRQREYAAQLRLQGFSLRKASAIAKLSTYTVQRLTDAEYDEAREHIRSQATLNAKGSAIELATRIEKAPTAVLNAMFGVAVDKILALSGDPVMTIRHEHLHANLSDHDMLEAMLARKAQRLTPPSPQANGA